MLIPYPTMTKSWLLILQAKRVRDVILHYIDLYLTIIYPISVSEIFYIHGIDLKTINVDHSNGLRTMANVDGPGKS